MRPLSPLHEIFLHRHGEEPMRRIHEMIPQPHQSRHVLNPSFAARQRVLPGLSTESVLTPASSPAESSSGVSTDKLTHHGGRPASALDEFDAGYYGVFFDDDAAVGADGGAGGAERLDGVGVAVGTARASGGGGSSRARSTAEWLRRCSLFGEQGVGMAFESGVGGMVVPKVVVEIRPVGHGRAVLPFDVFGWRYG